MKKTLLFLSFFLSFFLSDLTAQPFGCCEIPLISACFPDLLEADCMGLGGIWTNTTPPGGGFAPCDNPTPPCIDPPLPVELVEFSSIQLDKSISLSWMTASEINNEGFEVQISQNGIDWKKLGFVEGNGTSLDEHQYEFKIESRDLVLGANYFRLKQIDFDGKFEYSNAIGEIWSDNNRELVIAPNPAVDKLAVFIPKIFNNEKILYQIVNLVGKEIEHGTITNSDSQTLDISDLESGSYIIIIKSGRNQYIARFIKK